MFKVCRKLAVISLVGGAVILGSRAALGEGRFHAAVNQVHSSITDVVDDHIDDPAALRSQLMEFEKQFPKRIAEVRADLAELREEMSQIDRDRQIAERVVHLAERDIDNLNDVLAERTALASNGGIAQRVMFRDRPISIDRASSKVRQIETTRVQYATQALENQEALSYLRQQETRLESVLGELEHERAQFRSQIQVLTNEVDAIARNERLIKLLNKRKQTIESLSRYEPASLDHIQGKLASIKSRQEAELDLLAGSKAEVDYEHEARLDVLSQGQATAPAYCTEEEIEVPTMLTITSGR